MTAAARPTTALATDEAVCVRARRASPLAALLRKDTALAHGASGLSWLGLTVSLATTALLLLPPLLAWDEREGAGMAEQSYELFFVVAFVWTLLVGAGIGGGSLSSERASGTLPMVLFSGVRPRAIVGSKLLTAYARTLGSLVYLAPNAGVCLLVEGASAKEIAMAFVVCALVAAPACALGLVASAASLPPQTTRAIAVFVAILVAAGSVAGSAAFGGPTAHRLFPDVPGHAIVWLPLALARAPVDKLYLLALVVTPLAVVVVPTLALTELAIAGLRTRALQRARGLELCLLVSAPAVGLAASVPVLLSRTLEPAETWGRTAMVVTAIACSLAAIALASPPLAVVDADGRVRPGRPGIFAPPLTRTALALLACSLGSIGALTLLARRHVVAIASINAAQHGKGVVALGAYAAAFVAATVALGAVLGSTQGSRTLTRLSLTAFTLASTVLPTIGAALLQGAGAPRAALWLRAASPLFAREIADDLILYPTAHAEGRAGFVAIGCWAALAVALTVVACVRARRRAAAHAARRAEVSS